MAEPAFAAVGFEAIERQVVEIGNESFQRAKMEKTRWLSQQRFVAP